MKSWKSRFADWLCGLRFRAGAILLALIASTGLWLSPSEAQGPSITRALAQVDLHGVPAIAAHVRRALPGQLAAELYNRPVRGYPAGSRLVVRVLEVYLSHDGGSPFPSFGNGFFSMPDSIRAEVLVLDPRGRVLEQKPLTTHSPVSSGGGVMSPYNEPRRVQALIGVLAYWAVHSIGR